MESAERSEDRPNDAGGPGQDETDASRRAILGKMGRFAYAAPALALLAEPKAVKAYGRGTKTGHGNGNKNYHRNGPPGRNRNNGNNGNNRNNGNKGKHNRH
jgi:hypothetical protein